MLHVRPRVAANVVIRIQLDQKKKKIGPVALPFVFALVAEIA